MPCDERRKYLTPPVNAELQQLPPVPPDNSAAMTAFLQAVKNALEGASTNPIRPNAIKNFTVEQTDSGTQLVWDSDKNSAFYAVYRNRTNDFMQSRVIATVHAAGGNQRPGFFDVAGQDEVLSSRVYWVRGFSSTGVAGPLSTQTITVDSGVIPGDRPWTETLTPGEVRLVEQNNADPVVIRSYGSQSPQLNLVSINGTEDAPSATLEGDLLGSINFKGSDGVTEVSPVQIDAIATSNVISGAAFSENYQQLGGDGINGSWAATNQTAVNGLAIVGDHIVVSTYSRTLGNSGGGAPQIYRYTISTNTWTDANPSFPSGCTYITNLVVHNGIVYYGLSGSSTFSNGARLLSYDPATNITTTLKSHAVGSDIENLWSLALDPAGIIYIAENEGTDFSLYKYTIATDTLEELFSSSTSWVSLGSGSFFDICYHTDGFIYYTVNGSTNTRGRVYRYNIATDTLSAIGGYLIGGNLGNKGRFGRSIQYGAYLYVPTLDGEVWEWNNDTAFWTKIGGDGLNSSWSTTNFVRTLFNAGDFVYASVRNVSSQAELWQFTPDFSGATAGTWQKVADGPDAAYEDFTDFVVDSSTDEIYSGMGSTPGADADFWGVGTVAGSAQAEATLRISLMVSNTETVVTEWLANGDIAFGIEETNNNLMYLDEGDRRVGIGTNTPARSLSVAGGDGIRIAQGSPGTPGTGDLYIATTTGILTWHDGTAARRTVHAPSALTDLALVKGSGGVTGVQTTGILVSSVDAITGVTLLGLEDTDASHNLSLKWNENDSANRTLNILVGGASRSLTFTADATVGGTNSGDVTLAGSLDYLTISGQVITRGAIDLATDVTGDLPYANLTPAGAASKLLGRGDSGAGDWQEITLGTGLSMSGTTLNSSGGGGTVDVDPAGALDGDGSGGDPLAVRVDGVTIIVNGSNQLEATGSGGSHASTHEDMGADEIDVTGLSGELADPQPPKDHAADHEEGGGDELDVTALGGFPGGSTTFLRADGTFDTPPGAGWTLAGTCMDTGTTSTGSWAFTSNVTQVRFQDLAGFSEILIIVRDVTKGTTGAINCQASIDNGANWLTSSGDYINISDTGTLANTTAISMHATNATAARSGMSVISNWNSTNEKIYATLNRLSTGITGVIVTANDLDGIRIIPSGGGNFTGGNVKVYGR